MNMKSKMSANLMIQVLAKSVPTVLRIKQADTQLTISNDHSAGNLGYSAKLKFTTDLCNSNLCPSDHQRYGWRI